MNEHDDGTNWMMAWLALRRHEANTRVSEIYQENGMVWDPPITVWDANNPDTVAKVCDGFELQMMGIKYES